MNNETPDNTQTLAQWHQFEQGKDGYPHPGKVVTTPPHAMRGLLE